VFGRIPFVKFCAVTTALVCAGGGALIGHTSASGTVDPPSASLDHYLCIGDLGALCVPAKTTLPDGTISDVSNPLDRFVCDRHFDNSRRRGTSTSPTPVTVSNELGTAPVPLLQGTQQWTCSLVRKRRAFDFSHSHAQADAAPVATFSCSSVQYPPNPSTTFSTQGPLQIGDRLLVQVLDPAQLCVPTAPPTGAVTNQSLLCFRVRVAFRPHHFFGSILSLCVPSTVGGDPTTPLPTSTSTTTSTTAARPAPTTTTTTRPATTTTTTTPPTTTTTSTTTTSTTSPPTTTTTTHTQPCAGVLINGFCIITV
jgi:hypothetical protein